MTVFIDAHTHNLESDNPFSVINLNFDNVDQILVASGHKFFSLGVHPWDVHQTDSSKLDVLEEHLSDQRIRAIGECGFDRNAKATFKEQGYFFERQIHLSEKYERPLIIHCVAAFNELIRLRKKLKPEQVWMLHGFRGKPELAKQLLDNGLVLSFGEKFNTDTIVNMPLDKMCIETDCCDVPVDLIYKRIAALKNCTTDEMNAACRLLGLYVC